MDTKKNTFLRLIIILLILGGSSYGYAREQNKDIHQKQSIRVINGNKILVHRALPAQKHKNKKRVKIPNTVFSVPFLKDSSLYFSIGISDPVSDTLLAYNLAYNRAVAIASLMMEAKGKVLGKNNTNIINNNSFENITAKNVISSSDVPINFINNAKVVVRLSSGETIIFLPFKIYNKQTNSLQKKHKPESYATILKTDEKHTLHSKHNDVTDTSKISLHMIVDYQRLEYDFNKTGKQILQTSILNNDTIQLKNIYYKYYTKKHKHQFDKESYSTFPLQYGLWPAFLTNFKEQLSQYVLENNSKTMKMTRTDNDKKNSATFTRTIGTLNNILFQIKTFEIYKNHLYLKLKGKKK